MEIETKIMDGKKYIYVHRTPEELEQIKKEMEEMRNSRNLPKDSK